MNWVKWIFLFVLAAAGPAVQARIKMVTSFLPAYSLAANVAKDLAEVKNLLPAGAGLHDYQLTPGDLRELSSADVIVINGLGMEAFLDRALRNLGAGTEAKIVRMSEGIPAQRLIRHEDAHNGHAHGNANPHIWLDPSLMAYAVTNIAAALKKADPANAAAYERNAAEYVERLNELDREIAAQLKGVQDEPFITYHNAFPYFIRRYGLNLAGVVERVPEVPPSARELSQLHRVIRGQGVKALFTEPGGRTRLARNIARDAGVTLAELNPLETGEPLPAAYEQGMRRNARALAQALK